MVFDNRLESVKTSWMSRLKQGLSRTGQSLSSLFVGAKVDETLFEELEDALLMADAGEGGESREAKPLWEVSITDGSQYCRQSGKPIDSHKQQQRQKRSPRHHASGQGIKVLRGGVAIQKIHDI
ncbi:signal recognition particle-docking protein FtsY, partial [Alcaligenes faecalis subsp. faecalis NCIB 8687]